MNGVGSRPSFSDAYASLEWADAQVEMIAEEVRGFLTSNPYQITRERDKDGVNDAIYMQLLAPVPRSISPKVATAIQAQRNSLDYLAVALAEQNGAERLDDVYFPICKGEDGFSDRRTLKKISRLSDEHQEIILGLKPYKGGNDYLFALHWLNRETKHQRLATFAGATQLAKIGGRGRLYSIRTFEPQVTVDGRAKIAITHPETDVELHFAVDVKFTEVAGEQARLGLVPLLQAFSHVCRDTVRKFEQLE